MTKYAVRSFTVVTTTDDDPEGFETQDAAIDEAISQCEREIESAKYYISDFRSTIKDLRLQKKKL